MLTPQPHTLKMKLKARALEYEQRLKLERERFQREMEEMFLEEDTLDILNRCSLEAETTVLLEDTLKCFPETLDRDMLQYLPANIDEVLPVDAIEVDAKDYEALNVVKEDNIAVKEDNIAVKENDIVYSLLDKERKIGRVIRPSSTVSHSDPKGTIQKEITRMKLFPPVVQEVLCEPIEIDVAIESTSSLCDVGVMVMDTEVLSHKDEIVISDDELSLSVAPTPKDFASECAINSIPTLKRKLREWEMLKIDTLDFMKGEGNNLSPKERRKGPNVSYTEVKKILLIEATDIKQLRSRQNLVLKARNKSYYRKVKSPKSP